MPFTPLTASAMADLADSMIPFFSALGLGSDGSADSEWPFVVGTSWRIFSMSGTWRPSKRWKIPCLTWKSL